MLLLREPTRNDLVIRNPSARQSFNELWRFRSVIAPLFTVH
jgi:hypothetical protein